MILYAMPDDGGSASFSQGKGGINDDDRKKPRTSSQTGVDRAKLAASVEEEINFMDSSTISMK